jgi:hypothetical protein
MSAMNRITILLISCLLLTGMSYAGSDKTLLTKGYSYAPSLDGKATIHQAIALLERAVQQNDPAAAQAVLRPDTLFHNLFDDGLNTKQCATSIIVVTIEEFT